MAKPQLKSAPGAIYGEPTLANTLPPALSIYLNGSKEAEPEIKNGISHQELSDGSAVIDFAPRAKSKADSGKFNANLADLLETTELSLIADELLQGVQRDIESRAAWILNYISGMRLLGLQVESEKASIDANAPMEGMSQVRHPLMLEACLLFQATARGEMLPASGPVKVRDDRPAKPTPPPMMQPPAPPQDQGGAPQPVPQDMPPPPVPQMNGAPPPMSLGSLAGIGDNGGPPLDDNMESADERDEVADAFEKDFNHFLTNTASEYYPDTDQMNFLASFGGIGIKKVYNCPLRRRPVSEMVNIEDFIVSNALSSLGNAGRITHRINMRPSMLRRMQLNGAYRDIPLQVPGNTGTQDGVQQAKADLQGIQVKTDPKDKDHELYEIYCELDLDRFAPKQFKGKSLPLPFIVTIETQSREILQIRKNWKEKDKECQAKEYFVDYVFDRAFGFYGIGYLHILGNTTRTLTAAWREFIDSGMFANFPGFLYAKGMGRQLTNQFRIPPGGGVGLDIGLQDIRNAVMPLPYKDLGPSFVAFIQHVEEMAQRLGSTSNISVGEGKADAPVGTTMALIEQASKQIGAVLKRFHSAQAKEFQLFKERFKEDPEAFTRFNDKPATQWHKQLILDALNDYDIVPVSDPSNPTRLHRAAKGAVVQQLAMAAPMAFDIPKTIAYIGKQNEVSEITDLLNKNPPQAQGPQLDPNKQADIQGKMAVAQSKQQTDTLKAQIADRNTQLSTQASMAETKSRENIANINYNTELLKLASSMAIHSDTLDANERAQLNELVKEAYGRMVDQNGQGMQQQAQQQHDQQSQMIAQQHEAQQGQQDQQAQQVQAAQEHARAVQQALVDHHLETQQGDIEHQRSLEQGDAEHQQSMEQGDLDHQRNLEMAEGDRAHQVQIAKMKPKPTSNGAKKK